MEATAGLAQTFGSLQLPQAAADKGAVEELRDPFSSRTTEAAPPQDTAARAPTGRRQAASSPSDDGGPALAVGDAIAYQVSARHLGVPVTVVQRVVERKGGRLIVDETIDDGFVEPLALRLRIDETADGERRIVSVAQLRRGVQLPYGSAAYQDLMTLIRPPAEAGATAIATADAEARRFAWGGVAAEISADAAAADYRAEVVAMGSAMGEVPFRVAAVDASAGDYEAWDDESAVANPGERMVLASSEADYEAWEAESTVVNAAERVALASSEADYETWDAASAHASVTMQVALARSEADYEAWDTQSGMFGTIALPDFVTEAMSRGSAIATRDDSGDYVPEIEDE